MKFDDIDIYSMFSEEDLKEFSKEEQKEIKKDIAERLDNVRHPSHYCRGGIECWDAMEAFMTKEEFKGYLKGCAFKYIWRAGYKNNELEDIDKAINYLLKYKENI